MSARQVGDELPELLIDAVDPERMKTMALLLRDSNAIHFDVDVVRAVGLGDRPVNQGPINLGYVVRMVSRWAGGDDRILSFQSRFMANVFAGDHVVAGGRVVDVEPSANGYTVQCDVWLDHADGRRALQGRAVVELTSSASADS